MVTARTSQAAQATSWRGRVALVAKPGGPNTGVGRYVHMLHAGLQANGVEAVRVAPSLPPLPSAGYSLLQWFGELLPHYFGGTLLVTAAMMVYLLNQDMDNSVRITWLGVTALMPVLGVPLF